MMSITKVVLQTLALVADWTTARAISESRKADIGAVRQGLVKLQENHLVESKRMTDKSMGKGGRRHFLLYRRTALGAQILAERTAVKIVVRGPYKKKQPVVEPVYSTNPFEWQTGKRQTAFESTTARKPTPTARQKIRL